MTNTGHRYVDKDEVLEALRIEVPRLISLLRSVEKPEARAIGHWTVRDVAAHLTDVFEHYRRVALGEGSTARTIGELTGYNESRVEAIDERDCRVLAERIEAASGPYFEALSSVDGDPLVPWTQLEIPISTVVSLGIGEAIVHGYDVASAEGKPWPIDRHRIALALKGVAPIMPHYVDAERAAGFNARYELRLRGEWRMHFVFDDGKLSIEEPARRPIDVHISADPVAFALVGYGRMSQWGPMAKAQLLAWGRKPWLALKFATLLKNP
ncbi:MAG: maleylpyruvate isomerase family mycothiol-dependent enzyme [Actinomycetota bacterium]|nr:maleylpyruvate isomerase family mycothiol-dependent enzyme [Actinomycetota bacterium]